MFHLIGGFLVFVFLVILLVGFFIVFSILRFLGIGKKRGDGYRGSPKSSAERDDAGTSSDAIVGGAKRKKVFDKSEGEYIDFEDV